MNSSSSTLKSGRRGIAVYFILALLLSMSIMTLTWHFSRSKVNLSPNLLLKLKADYQLESAILLSFHRLRTSTGKFNAGDDTWNPRQEVAPGLILTSSCQEVTPGVFQVLAKVDGPGMSKSLSARVRREIRPPEVATAEIAIASEAGSLAPTAEATASESIQWRLELLPQVGEKR